MSAKKLVIMMMVVVLVLALGAPLAFAGQPEGKGKSDSSSLDVQWSPDKSDDTITRCLEKICRGAE